MENYLGEKFINDKYKYLCNTKRKLNIGDKNKSLNNYLNMIKCANKKHPIYIDKILNNLIENNIVSIEELKRQNYNDEEIINIRKAQLISLKKWVEFIRDETIYYDMWVKYWALKGLLSIGNHDNKKIVI